MCYTKDYASVVLILQIQKPVTALLVDPALSKRVVLVHTTGALSTSSFDATNIVAVPEEMSPKYVFFFFDHVPVPAHIYVS
jgi:hypothetical protein